MSVKTPDSAQAPSSVQVILERAGERVRTLSVPHGSSLREALLGSGLSPYRGAFRIINCHGFGICGSCRVLVRDRGTLWKRRACQIRCFQDIEIEIE